MEIKYVVQPDTQLGSELVSLLDSNPAPARIVFVSAFVSVQTLMRLKQYILDLKEAHAEVRFVLGIDLGGTSREALSEVLNWGIECHIVKHRIPGHTFHPKLYLFEWDGKAIVILGSNNLTEGGFYGNYEGAVRISYDLKNDAYEYAKACDELCRFLDPNGPVVKPLTEEFLKELVDRGYVPTEEEVNKSRAALRKSQSSSEGKAEPIFGNEIFDPPPPLPADLLERLIKDVRRRRSTYKKKTKESVTKLDSSAKPIDDSVSDTVRPAAFYMTLPTLQGKNIPGEGRIPLEAVELAKEFWGWPDEYSKEVSPRAGNNRVYWNWRPKWRIWDVTLPGEVLTQEVRMYMYENSSDFRFYVRPLVNAGADLGDVVRIRRIAEPDADFECVLARHGTLEYEEWIKSCTQSVRNSTRSFGYS